MKDEAKEEERLLVDKEELEMKYGFAIDEALKRVKDGIIKKESTLDLSGLKLHDLDWMESHKWPFLEEIDVSNNDIGSI